MTRPADTPPLPSMRMPEAGSDAPRLALRRDFASQDYLALSGLPVAAATDPATDLAKRLARFLHLARVETCSCGGEAIRMALRQILRPGDAVIIDAGAHPAMFASVLASGATPHRSPPGSADAVERRLRRLSAVPRRGAVFVALSAVSAYGSVIADLPALIDLARDHDARLILDVSHDLGSMGQGGGGVMEIQGALGRVDFVVGSLAKTFGAPGGFVGFRSDIGARRGPGGTLSPQHAARILAALGVVFSAEGRARRRLLHGNALRLRNHLMADGFAVMGQPSPLVPVRLPMLTATARTGLLQSAGAQVELLHAPQVGVHAPRWRLQLCSEHSPADLDDLAYLICDVSRVFDRRHLSRSPTYACGFTDAVT